MRMHNTTIGVGSACRGWTMNSQPALLRTKQPVFTLDSYLRGHAAVLPLADREMPLAGIQVLRSVNRDFSRVPVHASGPNRGYAEVPYPLTARCYSFDGARHIYPARVQAERDKDQAKDMPTRVPPVVEEVSRRRESNLIPSFEPRWRPALPGSSAGFSRQPVGCRRPRPQASPRMWGSWRLNR